MQIYLLYLIIMVLIYSLNLFDFLKYIVFFLCSLFIIYLGVLFFIKKKNISDIFVLIKRFLHIAWIVSLLINSNVNLITSYNNFIIENGLIDDIGIKEVVDKFGLTPNQQYYLKIGCTITLFIAGVIIIYCFNNFSDGSDSTPSSINISNFDASITNFDDFDSDYDYDSNDSNDSNASDNSDCGFIQMDIISESTVLPTVDLNGSEVVEYIITDSPEAELFNKK